MSWRRATGVLGVLLVIGITLGTIGSIVGTNDLFVSSALQLPALLSLAVILAGLAVIVFLGGPSRTWFGNPYW